MKRRIILSHTRQLGDIVTMTALVRDIALQRGGEFDVAVETTFPEVWRNNPHVVPCPPASSARSGWVHATLSYGRAMHANKHTRRHFLHAWHEDFFKQFNTAVPLTEPKPDLHLSDAERERPLPYRYWLVLSGGKGDFTAKWAVPGHVQRAVDLLTGFGLRFVQVGASNQDGDRVRHPRIEGTEDLRGKTTIREFIRLIAHAEGVMCPITSAMHIAAAFSRPCVVWAGGREEPWWEGYTNDWPGSFGSRASKVTVPHRYLHTMGLLDCCRWPEACWKSKVGEATKPRDNCKKLRPINGRNYPLCQMMITPERIAEAALSYYLDGTLKPLEGMMLPSVAEATRVVLPSGERVVLRIEPERASVPLPVLAPPVDPDPLRLGDGQSPIPLRDPRRHLTEAAATPTAAIQAGRRFTHFVLMYGDYPDMQRECLDAILRTTRREELELRVIANQLCRQSAAYVRGLVESGAVAKFYDHAENRRKYPVMREAFRDPACPITTDWVLWFDDDTMCNVDPAWLQKLSALITANDRPELGMVAPKQLWPLSPKQVEWMRRRPWYRGRQFRDKQGRGAPNGRWIHFGTGSCWALKTECILRCDIPEVELGHNGGDWTIGEQLYQGGYQVLNWTDKKQVVNWSSRKRRGVTDPFPGA